MNCKPGDLVVVVGVRRDLYFLGKSGVVLTAAGSGITRSPDGWEWRNDSTPSWWIEFPETHAIRNDLGEFCFSSRIALFGDSDLLPIRPEHDPLEQKHGTPRKERG